MGLYNGNLANYYSTPPLETQGAYQFVSLKDLINNFMVAYVGEDKIIAKINRADVKFHAMRGLQELTYDTFRSCKNLELEVPPSLILPIPHDYVEYTQISWIDSKGKCHVMNHCKSCPKDPRAWKQNSDGNIDIGRKTDGNPRQVLVSEGYWRDTDKIDETKERTEQMIKRNEYWYVQEYVDPVYETVYDQGSGSGSGPVAIDSDTWEKHKKGSGSTIDDWPDHELHYTFNGQRYGLEPKNANVNGCYWINCRTGQIHFDSNLVGRTIIIQYISDGLATDDEMIVHKFAEEAMYKHIAHSILNTRANVDRNIVATFKKERFAAVRNAKIRLSSIKLNEITQILRGKSKWIKH